MENLAVRLGKKLREIRGETPQLQFSKKLGISNSSLNRMEAGEQNVTLAMLDRLCERLKCDIGDLFVETGKRRKTGYKIL